MSYEILYFFGGSFTQRPDLELPNVDSIKIPVSLDYCFPSRYCDPLVVDCITNEMYRCRVLNHHSLQTSFPTWLKDYFDIDEFNLLHQEPMDTRILFRLIIQITAINKKFADMMKNVDFKEINGQQKNMLGTAVKPFSHLPVIDLFPTRFAQNGSSMMSRPTRVGYFSIKICNQKPVFLRNKSQLRYYDPPVNVDTILDLSSNYNQFAHWCRTPTEHGIIRWYWEHKGFMDSNDNVPSIITDSRTLATIMASPREHSHRWEIVAGKFHGKIFMYRVDTYQRNKRVLSPSRVDKLTSYAGQRFEQLVTKRYNGKDSTLHDGRLRDSFYTVNTANIGRHKLLYSARCTAVNKKDDVFDPVDDMDIVDVHTGLRDDLEESFWARNRLNRVSQVYFGKKHGEFTVTRIQSVSIDTILPNSCEPEPFFNFLDKTLDFITNTCKVEKGVYRFHHAPCLPVIVQKLHLPIESVIPRWYVNGKAPKPSSNCL